MPGVIPIDRDALAKQLEEVRRRGAYRVFKTHEKQGPLKVPVLCRVVAALNPEKWTAGAQDEALATVLEQAIQRLSIESLPELPQHLSWQQAVAIMYRLAEIPQQDERRIEDEYEGKHEFVQRAKYIQDLAGFDSGGRELKVANQQIRRQLAAILLEGEVMTIQPSRPAAREPEDWEEEGEQRDLADEIAKAEPDMSVKIYNKDDSTNNIVVGRHASQTINIGKL